MDIDVVAGVLSLQGDFREHAHSLAAVGVPSRPVRRPQDLDGIGGLVIPGGESTTMTHLMRTFDVWEPLAEVLKTGLPVYGSCAGMVLLGQTVLGGTPRQGSFGVIDMDVRRNAFGRQTESFEADIAVDGLGGDPYRAVFIRAPWVERVGPDVTVLSRVERDGVQHPVAVRQGNAMATAFHPEMTEDHRFHRLFAEIMTSVAASPAQTR